MTIMQSALRLIYPDRCMACSGLVEGAHGLCGDCWRETPFIRGLACDQCGQPLMGEAGEEPALCDDCLTMDRPWQGGRAALLYEGSARRMILGFKHGDRTDLAKPAARWMQRAGADLLTAEAVLVPVPSYWLRLVRRRYNQAAELAKELAAVTGCEVLPDGLRRVRRTKVQDGMTVEERQGNVDGAIVARRDMAGQRIVLIDDVMTSGATLSAATTACKAAGAGPISVLVLARVVKTP